MCEYSSDVGNVGGVCFAGKVRRARKARACGECGGTIVAGAHYRRMAGTSEGDIWTFNLCLPCEAVRDEFSKAHDGDRPLLGELDEALDYCVEEETRFDDDDNEIVTEAGQHWHKALDEMTARRSSVVDDGSRSDNV